MDGCKDRHADGHQVHCPKGAVIKTWAFQWLSDKMARKGREKDMKIAEWMKRKPENIDGKKEERIYQ